MTSIRRVLVHADKQALAGAVAARFITKVVDLLDQQAEVNIVLTGGTVGTAVLTAIGDSSACTSIDWSRVSLWWGDERWLPAGDPDRNETQARAALIGRVTVRPENVHAFASSGGSVTLDEAVTGYSEQLAAAADEGAVFPKFDITFLGVGPDGHVASLFPDSSAIQATEGTVVAVRHAPKPPSERLSLTLPVINSSDRIWLALAGSDKASPLGLALAGASTFEVPAAGVSGRLRTVFFVDEEAAAEVPSDLIATEY